MSYSQSAVKDGQHNAIDDQNPIQNITQTTVLLCGLHKNNNKTFYTKPFKQHNISGVIHVKQYIR